MTRNYFILDGSPVGHLRLVSRRLIAVLIYLLLPCAMGIAARWDHTWKLPGEDKGFSQHFGYWVLFLTTPVVLLLTAHLLETFTATISGLDVLYVRASEELRRKTEKLIARHLDHLSLRTIPAISLSAFFALVMLFFCIVNVINTSSPDAVRHTYGHDSYDALPHVLSFYVGKIYLFLVFPVVYAIALAVAFQVTYAMMSILRFLGNNDMLQINLFHEDNCGGTSRFGNANLLIMLIYANFILVRSMMYLTHHTTYFVANAALLGCSVAAAVQSVVAVYSIHRVLVRKKRECIEALGRRLSVDVDTTLRVGGRFSSDILAFRNHVAGLYTYPYARPALAAVNLIRFLPAALVLVTVLK
ncbi:MAG: hypothetical protein QOC81_1965 [Thermoanaerobaculia bacterium]|jgi:hypothetical protein|nr:hypothetical protein [Thermoanaerobaculia bacterium]